MVEMGKGGVGINRDIGRTGGQSWKDRGGLCWPLLVSAMKPWVLLWVLWDTPCDGLNCVPHKSHVEALAPSTQNVPLFGNGVITGIIGEDEVILE